MALAEWRGPSFNTAILSVPGFCGDIASLHGCLLGAAAEWLAGYGMTTPPQALSPTPWPSPTVAQLDASLSDSCCICSNSRAA